MVLDPLHMDLGRDVLSKKHSMTVGIMHRALCACIKKYFPTEEMIDGEWEKDYIIMLGSSCDR